jgi:HK97 gp10 family phage protein
VAGETVRVYGVKALIRKFESLEESVAGQTLEQAAMAGAEVVRQEASRRAPRRTGMLAGHIVAELKEGSAERVSVAIGPDKDAFYGMFQELGTVHHPAQPFLRPALDEKANEATRAVGWELGRAVNKAARHP